jgi:hypothetical protein
MPPFLLGFLRGLGFALLAAALTYIGNATNLSGILSPAIASLVAMIALGLEHSMSPNGTALFGTIGTRK